MEYNKSIADITPGDELEGFYILKDAIIKTTAAGKPFLSGSVSDRTGFIEIKAWDYSGPIGTASSDIGRVVKIRGEATEFKGNRQITVSHIRHTTDTDSFDIKALVPIAPIDVSETVGKLNAMLNSIEDNDYKLLAQTVLTRHIDEFKSIPAAKSVHHSFISGLLMHTWNMLQNADFLSQVYKNVINRSLLIAGTLLHDIAKIEEFTLSELGIVMGYSVKGQLLGHLVMGANEVAQTAKELNISEDKSVLLQHMLLSHHGEPEFGAAVVPMCAEAELLSYIDMIDSRMEIYAETLSEVPSGEFSGRIFSLEKRIYNHG